MSGSKFLKIESTKDLAFYQLLKEDRDRWMATAESRLRKIEEYGAKIESLYKEIDSLREERVYTSP